MLSKLIKYDIRATWREFAGINISILLGVIIVPFILRTFNNDIVRVMAGFISFSIIISVLVITIINLFTIFNTNVFSRQGYLTMTLPVTASQTVLSKIIVSSMWITLTGFVSVIGVMIFTLLISPPQLAELWQGFQKLIEQLNGMSVLTGILLILAVILSITKEIAKLFLSCSIGHIKQLNKFRVPIGILSYFIFSWGETLIVQGAVFLTGLFSERSQLIMKQLETMKHPESIDQFLGLFNGMVALGVLFSLLLVGIFSAGTIWILNHKLDLD